MRYIFRLFLLLLIAVPLAIAGAIYLALDDQPLVRRVTEFTPAHVERARQLLKQNDPRRMASGTRRTVVLTQEELDLLLNYLASRYGKGGSRVALQPGLAALALSAELPRSPLGRYLNIDALLRETGALPAIDSLRIGRLPVPSWLADWLLRWALRQADSRGEFRIVSDAIEKVSVADGRLSVSYHWQAGMIDRIKAVAVPRDEQERLKVYQQRLAAIVSPAQTGASVSLADLLPPLFRLAAERSAGGDPVAENRAVIAVLAFYVNGKGLAAIVPDARDWPRPQRRKVVLDRREDFPQHFMVSAAIAANAGGPLSDAIGLHKEIADSRGGSGFSFNDIAADRAGTRFGELAAGGRAPATKLQRQLGARARETDFMPAVRDLPEFMAEADFKRRFGGVGAPAYQRVIDDIEKRISALPLYR